ncbi:MAG: molecular chaperone [Desulfurivibrionaceae bacterium]
MVGNEKKITLGTIYRLLAQLMRDPAEELSDEIISVFYLLLDDLKWNKAKEEVRSALDNSDDFIEDLQTEYTRLFINASPHVIAPPYASVNMPGEGTLYGPISEKTKDFYKSRGYDLDDHDLPDHIVNELEFLAIMADEDQEGLEEFLQSLFRPWFAEFKAKVCRESQHPYYRVTIQLIDFFTKKEEVENGIQHDKA